MAGELVDDFQGSVGTTAIGLLQDEASSPKDKMADFVRFRQALMHRLPMPLDCRRLDRQNYFLYRGVRYQVRSNAAGEDWVWMGLHIQRNLDGLLIPLISEPLWLPTRLLVKEMNSKKAWRSGPFGFRIRFRPSRHICMKAEVFPDTWPTESHPTILFIREIAGGVDPIKTSLFRRIEAGEIVSRHIGTSGERAKVKIRSRDQFLQYAARVASLLELAAEQGIQPIVGRANVDPNIARRKEGDIGVAMLDNDLFFYRKGHHRLGAAMALGVEHVPCQCYFFSSNDENISSLLELKNRTISAFKEIS